MSSRSCQNSSAADLTVYNLPTVTAADPTVTTAYPTVTATDPSTDLHGC